MKKMIKSLANKAICAAFVVLGAMSVCAELVKTPILQTFDDVAEPVSVGYKVTGLENNEVAMVYTNHLRTATWTVPANLENVQFLAVGGGGGAGGAASYNASSGQYNRGGAGGGGGGVVTGLVNFVSGSIVSVQVGAGGEGGVRVNNTTNGTAAAKSAGGKSSFSVNDISYVIARGGGRDLGLGKSGGYGASNAGSRTTSRQEKFSWLDTDVNTTYITSFEKLGNYGGKAYSTGKNVRAGAGGGGATEEGYSCTDSDNAAKGGKGLASDITGVSAVYGSGGGGGSGYNGVGAKGGSDEAGVGGNSSKDTSPNDGGSGLANYGGGGGGAGREGKGGNGGSGIVVFRYVEPVTDVAKIGEVAYASLADAVTAAVAGDTIKIEKDITLNETFVVPADKEDFTIDLNGKTIAGAEGAKLSNFGTLTITDSSALMQGMIGVQFSNAGTANLKGGVFALGVENTGTIEVTGGAYLASAFDRAWVKAGYVCCDLGDDEMAIIAVAKLPTATITSLTKAELEEKNAPKDLNYTLKFKANKVSEFQMLCFTNWYADFEFTISADAKFNCSSATSDGYLAGQYDSWAKNWISVPTTDVELKANEPLRIMDFGAGLLKKPGLKMTYGEVATLVKEFSCGVALRPEFIAKNPGLTVKLTLKMYNPKNESEFYTIGNEYTFELPAETDNAIIVGSSGAAINCETLQDAIDAIADLEGSANGSEISILKNYEINDDLTVSGTRNLFFNIGENKSITLAEGKKITISGANVAFVGEGSLVGFTADNIELEDKSVLTLPEAAQALAESFEAKGKYVTQNDDETWSVANELTLQIQVVDGEPSVGFLKDTRRDYTIEGSADLKSWGDVEAESDNLTQGADIALPLKWHKPASGYFFRVKAEKKSN